VHLRIGLAAVLIWVGVKMGLADVYHVPTSLSLAVIAVILAVAVGWSLRSTRGQGRRAVRTAAASPFRVATQEELDALQPLPGRRVLADQHPEP
jgi:tellurite resistance protein TerC